MIAYNKTWLDNEHIREEVASAYHQDNLSSSEKENIYNLYPVGFYTPNFFIRIGLFILSVVIAGFSLGLLTLLLLSNIEQTFKGLILFFGLVAYGMLEYFIKEKKHYKSGVDDALLWLSAVSIIVSLNLIFEFSYLNNSIIIFIIAGYLSIRFADLMITVIATISLIAIVFFLYVRIGTFAQLTAPFILMVACAAMYFLAQKLFNKKEFRHYNINGIMVEGTLLICFYLAGNYFVITEMGSRFFHSLKENESIALSWFFGAFTVAVPILYIWRGIKKKDALLIRVGLVLIAAAVFTVRYYHFLLPLQIAMVLGGILLITISLLVTKYLAKPTLGFTSTDIVGKSLQNKLNIEALVISETFGNSITPAPAGTEFGGGSGGGGGASGEF